MIFQYLKEVLSSLNRNLFPQTYARSQYIEFMRMIDGFGRSIFLEALINHPNSQKALPRYAGCDPVSR